MPDSGAPAAQPTPHPKFPATASIHESAGTGRVSHLGVDVTPERPTRGQTIKVTQYLRVDAPLKADYDVFLHLEVPGDEPAMVVEHRPEQKRTLTTSWKEGEIIVLEDTAQVPDDLASGIVEMFAGLAKGGHRLPVDQAVEEEASEPEAEPKEGEVEGELPAEPPPHEEPIIERVRLGTLEIQGEIPQLPLPEVTVQRASGKMVADGVLSEKAWAKAQVLTLSDTLGDDLEVRAPTKVRLLYDDQNLYVSFECVDHDVTEHFSKPDEPIFEHEAVELLIMPNVVAPAVGPYVELGASPGGVFFDAAYTGRRRNGDLAYSAGQTLGTKIDGTLNSSGDKDKGWVSEWIIPWKGIRGALEAPKPGAEWRLNAFRMEKFAAKERTGAEYTAWSPPRVPDFHNTARFGRMKFGER